MPCFAGGGGGGVEALCHGMRAAKSQALAWLRPQSHPNYSRRGFSFLGRGGGLVRASFGQPGDTSGGVRRLPTRLAAHIQPFPAICGPLEAEGGGRLSDQCQGPRWWTGESTGGGGCTIKERVIQQVSPTFCRLVCIAISFRAHSVLIWVHLLSQRKAPMAMSLKSFLF